jgi:glycosyltransferase XagB
MSGRRARAAGVRARGATLDDTVLVQEHHHPLVEPSQPAGVRLRSARAPHDYDFLLAGPPGVQGVTPEQLNEATATARQCGLSTRRVLIGTGMIGASDYVACLSRAIQLPILAEPTPFGLKTGLDPHNLQQAWAQGIVDGRSTVALDATVISPRALSHLASRLTRRGFAVALTTPDGLRGCVMAWAGPALLRHAVSGLARSDPGASARAGSWLWQALSLAALAGAVFGSVVIGGLSAQWLLTVLGTLPFLLTVALRTTALLTHQTPPHPTSPDDMGTEDRDLPLYTIMVPMFREAAVLPDLVDALRRLDYPAAKLDIKLVLESVDAATIAAARSLKLRPPFELVIVPDREPRTKPKALNYALAFARGDYVCVFDAEDRPEPGQLREAWRMFASESEDLACVQGRLAIDNERESWFTRQFALEYLMLFDGLLPAFERLDVPMPLGGTSNHFPVRVLRKLGGWDAYNVTEDADLGLRLARHGYRARMLVARTYEEAPVRFGSWLKQRTRWLKGWMQTYIVHSRRPLLDVQMLGPWRWLGMHAHFAGIILSCLLYPFSIGLLCLQVYRGQVFQTDGTWIEQALLLAALVSLFTGHGIAILHAGVSAIGRRRWSLLLQLPTMPIYWLLISLAAYRALFQLAYQPFLWEKTTHGQSRRDGDRPAAVPKRANRNGPRQRVLHSKSS